ncbi:hypothetical protein AB0I27_06895 [Streptomyces sp. NPDC050597]|uniref:hypothetical protein n=1 Tax=Streptomyces TaxID=1883 RepID=UPI002DD87EB7|nr:hypothetical protein [Streptomyces phaeochromogenes]WRZ29962.1 hypothetical protein OG931_20525 [Streptomyces phaeochromogenes]
MNGRTLYVLTVAALALGVTIGLLGLVGPLEDEGDMTRAGILVSLATLPSLCYWQTQRAHQDMTDRVADAHATGYRLALEHVARGLLDQPTAPPGPGNRATDERVAGNVIQLRRLTTDNRSERTAL